MLGIFTIIMSPKYGEGSRGFTRLQHALLATTDESLFAWRMPNATSGEADDIERTADISWSKGEWGVLAPTPDWFAGCGRVSIDGSPQMERDGEAFRKTRQGLHVFFLPERGKGKYKALIVLGGMLFCLGIPLCVYVVKRLKQEVPEHGMPFTLKCWRTNEAGGNAAVQIFMQPLVIKPFTQGDDVIRYKRIRCVELVSTVKYVTKGSNAGEGFVVQPELSFGD